MLGMVHVLEGMSAAMATAATASLQAALVPADRQGSGRGFSYLSSHGSLDQEHVGFFRDLVDGLGDAAGEQAIIDTARIVYRLYGDIFRGIDRSEEHTSQLQSLMRISYAVFCLNK